MSVPDFSLTNSPPPQTSPLPLFTNVPTTTRKTTPDTAKISAVIKQLQALESAQRNLIQKMEQTITRQRLENSFSTSGKSLLTTMIDDYQNETSILSRENLATYLQIVRLS